MSICLWLVIQPNAVLLKYMSPAKFEILWCCFETKSVAIGYELMKCLYVFG